MSDDLSVVTKKMDGQIKEQTEVVDNLKKKQVYLETTFRNAQSHMNEILGRR
jgi:t-SNARE complex subunit (syntaxin)